MPRLVAPHLPADALSCLDQPVLHHDGLVLRAWRAQDAPAVRAVFDVPDIQRWHLARMDDLAEAQRWTRAWARRWAAGTDASWAITLAGGPGPVEGDEHVQPDGDEAVGYVALRAIHLHEGSAELSYWVAPPARGRGVASGGAWAVARWALEELGLHRVWLMHSTANPASCAVAQRAGFTAEGVLREHLRHVDGWHDMHVHARLAPSSETV